MKSRILIFAHDSTLYGASRSLLTILEQLANDKFFELFVLLPYGGEMEKRLDLLKVNYHVIPFPRCVESHSNSFITKINNTIKYKKREYNIFPLLQTLVLEFKPNLIYTNTSVISIGYKLASKINVPHIWHIREFGDASFDLQYVPSRNSIIRKIKNSTVSIFTSQALRKHWVDSESIKFKVIYNGISSNPLNRILSFPSRTCRFGLIGILLSGKGQEIAIEAFSNALNYYPNSELHFYGDIPNQTYFEHLQKLISQKSCSEKIIFHSFIEDNRLIYKELDVLLSCASSEGFGRTIIEAMSNGIPVIANASGGPLEIIDDGINGLLYEKTPERLAEKMISLLSNPVLYEEISKNSLSKASQNFSVEKYIKEILLAFKDAISI